MLQIKWKENDDANTCDLDRRGPDSVYLRAGGVPSPVLRTVGGSISLGSTAGSGPGDPAPCEPGTAVTVWPGGAARVECPPVGRRARPPGPGVVDARGAPECACCGRGAAARGRAVAGRGSKRGTLAPAYPGGGVGDAVSTCLRAGCVPRGLCRGPRRAPAPGQHDCRQDARQVRRQALWQVDLRGTIWQ